MEVRTVQEAMDPATARLTELEAEVGQLTDQNVILQTDVDDAEVTQEALFAVRE